MPSVHTQIYVMIGILVALCVVVGLVIGGIIPISTQIDYVERTDLDPYAKKTDLSTYATKTETTGLSGYVKTSVLSDYAKKVDLVAVTADGELFADDVVRQTDLIREVYDLNRLHTTLEAEFNLSYTTLAADLDTKLTSIRSTASSNHAEANIDYNSNYKRIQEVDRKAAALKDRIYNIDGIRSIDADVGSDDIRTSANQSNQGV